MASDEWFWFKHWITRGLWSFRWRRHRLATQILADVKVICHEHPSSSVKLRYSDERVELWYQDLLLERVVTVYLKTPKSEPGNACTWSPGKVFHYSNKRGDPLFKPGLLMLREGGWIGHIRGIRERYHQTEAEKELESLRGEAKGLERAFEPIDDSKLFPGTMNL
jgi:hypothetical protein